MVFVDRVVTSKTKTIKGLDSAISPTQPAKAEQEAPVKAEAKNQAVEAEKPKRGKKN